MIFLLLIQVVAILILLSRLLKGASRRHPLLPKNSEPCMLGSVSVITPTLNEVERLAPCLQGLTQQSYEVREFLVVDSSSTDGTQDLVLQIQSQDPRFHLLQDTPLPHRWVGRPWALHYGFEHSSPSSEWILEIDADTQPQPGLVPALIDVAQKEGYHLLSLSPQFILKYPGEWWLQPALLMTLLYRFDSAGVDGVIPERIMANGQCFFCSRQVLKDLGGHSIAASSFCDDVTLARYAATKGYKVGFLDGCKLLRVRMYDGFWDTWHGWGRSLDLKDASSGGQLLLDLSVLLGAQAAPILLLVFLYLRGEYSVVTNALIGVNGFLLLLRCGLLVAVSSSYYKLNATAASWTFWLSPLADPLAVARIFLSALTRPNQWRGRVY